MSRFHRRGISGQDLSFDPGIVECMTSDPTARMLRLLSLLQTRREWAGLDLAGRLGVTVRTVRRDIDRLREMGYPVDSARGHGGGYRQASGTDLPPLLLDDEEAVAIAVALRTAAGGLTGIEETALRALAKLEQVLPRRLRGQVAALQGSVTGITWEDRGPRTDPALLAALVATTRSSPSTTPPARGRPRPAVSSPAIWSPRAASGTSSPTTWTRTTGASSASTAYRPRPRPATACLPAPCRARTPPRSSPAGSRPHPPATAPSPPSAHPPATSEPTPGA